MNPYESIIFWRAKQQKFTRFSKSSHGGNTKSFDNFYVFLDGGYFTGPESFYESPDQQRNSHENGKSSHGGSKGSHENSKSSHGSTKISHDNNSDYRSVFRYIFD